MWRLYLLCAYDNEFEYRVEEEENKVVVGVILGFETLHRPRSMEGGSKASGNVEGEEREGFGLPVQGARCKVQAPECGAEHAEKEMVKQAKTKKGRCDWKKHWAGGTGVGFLHAYGPAGRSRGQKKSRWVPEMCPKAELLLIHVPNK